MDVHYVYVIPFTVDSYGGISRNGGEKRDDGHHAQISVRRGQRTSVDKAHAMILKKGRQNCLGGQLGQLPEGEEATSTWLREVETRQIVLYKHNMNTQQQNARGIPTKVIID